jgi:hypothetical protein
MMNFLVRSITLAMLLVSSIGVCTASEISDLKARVATLEKRLDELEKALKASAAKTSPDQLRAKQQAKARERMRRDSGAFSQQELSEIETLYQVANKKWQSPEAQDSLKTLVRKYKKANRTGCAILYLGQMSKGDEQIAYLKQAIGDHSDCFYGDGAQVGALARLFLGKIYLDSANAEKAKTLFDEIRKNYPDAIDHNGNPLVEELP